VAGAAGGARSTHGGRGFMPLWCEFFSPAAHRPSGHRATRWYRWPAVVFWRYCSTRPDLGPLPCVVPWQLRQRGLHRVGGRRQTELLNPA